MTNLKHLNEIISHRNFAFLIILQCIPLNAVPWPLLLVERRELKTEIRDLNKRVRSMKSAWDLSDDDQALDNFYVLYDQLTDRLREMRAQLRPHRKILLFLQGR